jgi:hypothetical protein
MVKFLARHGVGHGNACGAFGHPSAGEQFFDFPQGNWRTVKDIVLAFHLLPERPGSKLMAGRTAQAKTDPKDCPAGHLGVCGVSVD